MKYLISFLFVQLFASVHFLKAQDTEIEQGFIIKGVIKGIGNSKVLLGNKPRGYANAFKIHYYDSCMSKNDTIFFKGHVKKPQFFSIEVPEKTSSWVFFVVDNSIFQLHGSIDSLHKAVISGGVEWPIYQDYMKNTYRPIAKEKKRIFNQLAEKSIKLVDNRTNENRTKLLMDSLKYFDNMLYLRQKKFILNHPSAFVSISELRDNIQIMGIKRARKMFMLLSEDLKDSSDGKDLHYILYDFNKDISIGNSIKNFMLPNIDGSHVKLSDFKGKCVILDFWASWCEPCIREMPDLKNIYKKFKDSGLEIIGVSLDTEKDQWLKASKKNEIDWINLSDLMGMESPVIKMFNINSIPQKYFLDRTGKIVCAGTMKDLNNELNKGIK